jgi:hypothetical protein
VTWSVAHIGDEDRREMLKRLRSRIVTIFNEVPLELPRLEDFPGWGIDVKKRFAVTITRRGEPDDAYRNLIAAERKRLAELHRSGIVTSASFSTENEAEWQGFLQVRPTSRSEAQRELQTLPLARYLEFEITEIQ